MKDLSGEQIEIVPSQQNTHANNAMKMAWNLWKDDSGQDMIEYTLLVAFVALAAAAVYIGAGKQVRGIWSQANSTLVLANAAGS